MTLPSRDTIHDLRADSRPAVLASPPHGAPCKLSLRDAINAKCRECIYDPLSGMGTWREQVDACTSPSCPLFPVRPSSRQRGGGKA